MIYSAIIADDEQRIIQLLKDLIDWEMLGIKIVAEANNGMDALLYVKEFMPDILITDIRFPGIDGLELTKRVYEINPEISTVIISGYKQFDYAHTALKYGVIDYLVKPINKYDLEVVLKKICQDKKVRDNGIKQVEELKEQKIVSSTRLRNQFINDCLSYTMQLNNLDDINREYLYAFNKGNFISILVHLNAKGASYVDHHIVDKTKIFFNKLLIDKFDELQTLEVDEGVIVIGNYSDPNSEEIDRLLSKSLHLLRMELEFYSNMQITVAISDSCSNPMDFPKIINHMVRAMSAKCMIGSKEIIYAKDFNEKKGNNFLTDSNKIDIVDLVAKYAANDLLEWIKEKFDSDQELLNENPYLAFEGAMEIVSVFASVIIDEKLQDKFINTLKREILNTESLVELTQIISDTLSKELIKKYEEKKLRNSQPIRLAKEFMKENLSKQITVEDVATSVNLSYTYFSGLFKNETGITVSQFLLNIRIEKAKKYLKETTMNLSEISDCVGYSDSKHFSKLFKKATGISFKEYKRLYS